MQTKSGKFIKELANLPLKVGEVVKVNSGKTTKVYQVTEVTPYGIKAIQTK